MRRLLSWILLFGLFLPDAAGRDKPLDSTAVRGFEFLPGKPAQGPPIANPQEPRAGVRKEIGTSRLKLDLGSSIDLLGFTFDEGRSRQIRFGADFFATALTTSAQGLRLQVDAVDGFFGGHVAYTAEHERSMFGLRLRIMHLSAHFVDGHIDVRTGTWRDGKEPIPFTRDFGELLGSYTFAAGPLDTRVYTGFSYATLVRPVVIKRWNTLHGVELSSAELFGPAFGRPFSLYIADNLTLVGVPEYVGTNVLEFGGKFGPWNGTGIRLYLNYASGLELFSQYFNVRNDRWGIGFAFDVM